MNVLICQLLLRKDEKDRKKKFRDWPVLDKNSIPRFSLNTNTNSAISPDTFFRVVKLLFFCRSRRPTVQGNLQDGRERVVGCRGVVHRHVRAVRRSGRSRHRRHRRLLAHLLAGGVLSRVAAEIDEI